MNIVKSDTYSHHVRSPEFTMPFSLFQKKFEEIAEKETRSIILFSDPDLPDDQYGLIESYCDEPDCDCRRVFFNVFALRRKEIVAVIAYGWESKKFYAEWLGDNDPEIIKELQGPILNTASRQSKLAPALLEKVKYILNDKNYVERLKRHYKMFKETIENEGLSKTVKVEPKEQIGRNAPCPCGSGKKYKKCCMKGTA